MTRSATRANWRACALHAALMAVGAPRPAWCAAGAGGTPVALTGDAAWVVPPEVARPSELRSDAINDTAQGLALRDVELDWYKVTGYRAVIYSNESFQATTAVNGTAPVVFFGDVARHPWLEATFNLSQRGCGLDQGAEAHCLLTVPSFVWNGAIVDSPAVVAVGNGTRGAVFAAYALSEHVLGVAPFYRFTFAQPAWKGAVEAPPVGSVKAWAPPRFRHRCVFFNDEELLGFFRRDPLGEQVFDLATVDDLMQTLLRAKGNCVIMGTTPYPDERSLRMAARRGVVLTASHFEILGFNAFAWSQAFARQSTQLWDWTTHPDMMAHTWQAAIAAQQEYEMLWSVGLRGLNDYAYPNCNWRGTGPTSCGEIISQAVGNQTELLMQATGKTLDELDFKFNLWTEALGMYQRGELRLPPRTSLVMSDSGSGFIDGDAQTFAAADGVYYHVQMLNGAGGQLTEFVPPSRIFEQISSFCHKARSTSIFVLNLSDLKPAVLTVSAALRFVWDPTPYLVNSSTPGVPNRTADEAQQAFLLDWVAEQFPNADTSVANEVAALWTSYFDLPWVARGDSDEALGGAIGGIAGALAQDLGRNFSVSSKTVQTAQRANSSFVPGLANATAVHTAAVALLGKISPARQQFFRSHLLVQSAMQRHSVEIIQALSAAVAALARSATPSPSDVAAANERVCAALATFDTLFQAQRDAEGDAEWRGMYWADRHRCTNYQARRREVLRLRAALRKSGYSPDPQIDCCQMEYAYQWTPEHLASYPLMYDDPDVRARDFVLVSCANATKGGGLCDNNRTGGAFDGSATITLSLVEALQEDGVGIVYSTDGSVPQTEYKAPFTVTQTTTVRAQKVTANGAAGVARNVTYWRRQ